MRFMLTADRLPPCRHAGHIPVKNSTGIADVFTYKCRPPAKGAPGLPLMPFPRAAGSRQRRQDP